MSSSQFAAEAAAALADAAGCMLRASEALMAFAGAAGREVDDEEDYPSAGESAPVFGLATSGLFTGGRRARPAPPVEIRGPRQRAIVEILRRAGDDGEITRVLSERVGYGRSNTYMTLKNLQSQGVVALMEGCDPQRWRLRT